MLKQGLSYPKKGSRVVQKGSPMFTIKSKRNALGLNGEKTKNYHTEYCLENIVGE